MINCKHISVKLVKALQPYLRLSTENFMKGHFFDKQKMARALSKLAQKYPQYPVYIDLREANLAVVSKIIELKKTAGEMNINLLLEPQSPHIFTLEMMNETASFRILYLPRGV